jgi:hypothetical protein
LHELQAARDQQQAHDRALHDTRGFVHPVVVDRELLEVRDTNDDSDDADVQQPA